MGLLNRSHVKAFILQAVLVERPGWECRRVSASAYGVIERATERAIRRMLRQHPSRGCTFGPVELTNGH